MATTTNFALNKPTVGGDENTWGGLTNDNWDDVDNLLRIAMPAGGIIMWSGSIASIPTGWLLCDGTNGTPNLQNRFIVGAGDTHAPGDTGGADSVTLAEANLPSHTHTFSATTSGQSADHTHSGTTGAAGEHDHTLPFWNDANDGGRYSSTDTGIVAPLFDVVPGSDARSNLTSTEPNHTHAFTTGATSTDHTHTVSGTTGATGSGTAIDNRPAFYALAYIMKAA